MLRRYSQPLRNSAGFFRVASAHLLDAASCVVMADHRGIADVLAHPVEVEAQYAEQRIAAVHCVQVTLPVSHAHQLECMACLAKGVDVGFPAQGLRVMQVEHRPSSTAAAAVERNKPGEKVHRHQVEIQLKVRHQAQLE